MLPSLVARDIEKGLRSYVSKEFPVATRAFTCGGKSVIDAFLDKQGSLTKGPWVEVNLPFRKVSPDEKIPFTHLDIQKLAPEQFPPYVHQKKAFDRLQWKNAQSTLVATGTGSGKTECFLYPILDYCLANSKKGIKAIIIYPMNALASDQEKRLASLISKIETQGQGKVTAGLYTGDDAEKHASMGADYLISDRNALRASPPDILLTNYRMLDFLLMRPEDQSLWEGNGPEVFRYLIVDELHTFDGAKATDLACLIRRLKDRLHLNESLACIGTSATIGKDLSVLCEYASKVFAVSLDKDSVIGEDRLSAEEFLATFGEYRPMGRWPDGDFARVGTAGGIGPYMSEVVENWFGESLGFVGGDITGENRINLSRALPMLEGFRRLVSDIHGVTSVREIAERWCTDPQIDIENLPDEREEKISLVGRMVDSLVAMISVARQRAANGVLIPFLNVRSQLWIRELSRAVVTVGHDPEMQLSADLPNIVNPLAMPLVGCRECNRAAWGGILVGSPNAEDAKVTPDLGLFYESWFQGGPESRLFYPIADIEEFHELIEGDSERKPDFQRRRRIYRLCPVCHKLQLTINLSEEELFARKCSCCGAEDTVLVWVPDIQRVSYESNGKKKSKPENRCPHCMAVGGLRIFGGSNSALTASAIAHLNASPFSEDHKVIAFSDSVQDAALRAGFIDARNFLSVVRHAIVHYLSVRVPSGREIYFDRVIKELPDFWIGQFEKCHASDSRASILAKAEFLATFIAQDQEWMRAYETFSKASQGIVETYSYNADGDLYLASTRNTTPEDALCETFNQWNGLYEKVRERLVWEALLEFGYRSLKGRSVSRIGAATLFPKGSLKSAAKKFASDLQESCRITVTEERAQKFLNGILDMMRTFGAFDVNEFATLNAPTIQKEFGEFLKTGNDYAFNRSLVLPNYGKYNNPPNSVSLRTPMTGHFSNPVIHTKSSPLTWFEDWARRLLCSDEEETSGLITADETLVVDIYQRAFKALEEQRTPFVVSVVRNDKTPSWVLATQHMAVSTRLKKWRCSTCGRIFTFAEEASECWRESPCLSLGCKGTLRQLPSSEYDTESDFYRAPPVRIKPREHTGLIDGVTRSRIEKSFATSSEAWAVNLLSATPTLEMGIDIGKLSSVMQCTMPPSVANYMQRIGRAGRRDGNALALTVASHDVHGQYFWTSPEEMIQAEVIPPGVFLRAVSVLERQLVAFAITHWVERTTEREPFRRNLGDTISAMSGKNGMIFPAGFLRFVSDNAETLYRDFCRFFEGENSSELTEEAKDSLHKFILGDTSSERMSLVNRINASFERAKIQRECLYREYKNLNNTYKKLQQKAQDPERDNELEEVQQQLSALAQQRKDFNEKPIFQFMTDEGLLPNYAFPEEGVTVDSVIVKRKEKKADPDKAHGRYMPTRFSFARGASQAIRELAPNSYFYANAHRLHVDQVKFSEDSVQSWRFCPACSYTERVIDEEKTSGPCPACGCLEFADHGRVKTVLRLRELIAHADIKDDRIDDRKDRRELNGSTRRILIMEPKDSCTKAWRIDDPHLGFGFEFLKNVTIREFNFGPSDKVSDTQGFDVAGEKVPEHGYKICKKCGMVFKDKGQHDFTCPWRGKTEDDSTQDRWYDGLFLFREMKSEAIRIRVPVASVIDKEGAEKGTYSLIAAIELGLKKHFKGSVDHLNICMQTAPDPENPGTWNNYIVLYDTIPGGSGYLKDLMRFDERTNQPEQMMEMFREAYEAVSQCSCARDPKKDGCYHCVYCHSDFSRRKFISRAEAEDILQRIVDCPNEKIVTTKDIRNIQTDNMNVLEGRLVKWISEGKFVVTMNPTKEGKTAYDICVDLSEEARQNWKAVIGRDPGEKFVWRLEPQVDVGSKEVGAYPSRPDFCIYPKLETLLNGHPELKSFIFTDGWKYHYFSLSDDTRKRQALLNRGFRVWSFTWEDLASSLEKDSIGGKRFPAFTDCLCGSQNQGKYWSALFDTEKTHAEDFGKKSVNDMLGIEKTSLGWFTAWLNDPFALADKARAAVEYVALTQERSRVDNQRDPQPLVKTRQWQGKVNWAQFVSAGVRSFDLVWAICREEVGKNSQLHIAMRIDDEPFKPEKARSDERLHLSWAMFWQFANIFQFGGNLWCCTKENETDGCYDPLERVPPKLKVIEDNSYAIDDAEWDSLAREFSEYDDSQYEPVCKLIEVLRQKKIAFCDDVVDGVESALLKCAQGFTWNRAGKDIFLFAKETGCDDVVALNTENRRIVIASDDSKWVDELVALLS